MDNYDVRSKTHFTWTLMFNTNRVDQFYAKYI